MRGCCRILRSRGSETTTDHPVNSLERVCNCLLVKHDISGHRKRVSYKVSRIRAQLVREGNETDNFFVHVETIYYSVNELLYSSLYILDCGITFNEALKIIERLENFARVQFTPKARVSVNTVWTFTTLN